MKKTLTVFLLSSLFLTGCSFSFDTKIPKGNPPQINYPQKNVKGETQNSKEENKVENNEVNEAIKYNVILPSEEKETEKLLDEYEASLDNFNKELK